MSEKLCFFFHTSYRSVLVACYLQHKSFFSYCTIALFACARRVWATPSNQWNMLQVWTHETHCCSTRHVPMRMPRPCLCTIGVMQSRTDHLLAATHAAEVATQKTHCSCTRHVPRSVPRPWPCTTVFNKNKYIRYNWNNTLRHPTTNAWHYMYPYPYYSHTIYVLQNQTWSVSTRLVLRRLPIPSPSTTDYHTAYGQ